MTWRGRAAIFAASGAAAFALPTANAKPLPSPTGQSPTSARRREEEYLMPLQKKLGVLRLEGWGNPQSTGTGVEGYVPLAGDIDDRDSYDFAFIGEVAEGCTFAALCKPASFDDPEHMKALLPGVQNAIKRLVVRGAQAIIGNCGLFMWLHANGLIEQAVDKAMDDLGADYTRPQVMLSSLTTLAYDTGLASCATFGVGEGQEGVGPLEPPAHLPLEALAFWRGDSAQVQSGRLHLQRGRVQGVAECDPAAARLKGVHA